MSRVSKRLTDTERKEVIQKAVDKWGVDAQKKMAIEEMSELIKELCKTWRDNTNSLSEGIEESRQEVVEEVADSIIMLMQLRYIYGEDEVEKMIDHKLRRTLKRLDEQETSKC